MLRLGIMAMQRQMLMQQVLDQLSRGEDGFRADMVILVQQLAKAWS